MRTSRGQLVEGADLGAENGVLDCAAVESFADVEEIQPLNDVDCHDCLAVGALTLQCSLRQVLPPEIIANYLVKIKKNILNTYSQDLNFVEPCATLHQKWNILQNYLGSPLTCSDCLVNHISLNRLD